MKTEREVENYAKHRESVRGSIKKTVAESKEPKRNSKPEKSYKHTGLTNKPIEVSDRPVGSVPESGHWGYHLILDVGDCNKKIDDEAVIEDFLKQMVKEIKMKPIGKPIIIRVDSKKEGRGVTGIQVIESSTITFHGDDDGYAAYIDIFSCAPYDPKLAINLVKKYFEPKHMGDLWIHRDAGPWPHKGK